MRAAERDVAFGSGEPAFCRVDFCEGSVDVQPRERQGIAVAHGLAERSERTERLARAAEIPERPGPHDHRDRARIRGREEPADRIHIGTDIAVDQMERGVGRLECLGRREMPDAPDRADRGHGNPGAVRQRRGVAELAQCCLGTERLAVQCEHCSAENYTARICGDHRVRYCVEPAHDDASAALAVQQAQEAFGVAAHRVPLLGPNEILAGVLDVGDATLFGVPLRRDLEHTGLGVGVADSQLGTERVSQHRAVTPIRQRSRVVVEELVAPRAVRGPLRRPPDRECRAQCW